MSSSIDIRHFFICISCLLIDQSNRTGAQLHCILRYTFTRSLFTDLPDEIVFYLTRKIKYNQFILIDKCNNNPVCTDIHGTPLYCKLIRMEDESCKLFSNLIKHTCLLIRRPFVACLALLKWIQACGLSFYGTIVAFVYLCWEICSISLLPLNFGLFSASGRGKRCILSKLWLLLYVNFLVLASSWNDVSIMVNGSNDPRLDH